jgi:hypothetical protein
MNGIIKIAAALLVLQIGLAVVLYVGDTGTDMQKPNTPLLGFTVDAVTTLTLTDPEKGQLVLQKSGTGWILPSSFNAPANAGQVSSLLAKLAGLKQGFAVATTAAAGKRFKVADDLFQRHVVVKAGDSVVGDLYVGTSPGFRQIHARKAGTEGVVTVELSTFELDTSADQWLDKNMMHLAEEDIDKLIFADFTLEKKDKAWQLADLPDGQATDAKAAEDVVAKASRLTVQTVLGQQEAEPLFTKSPALHYTISRKGGGTVDFRLVKGEGDFYVLKQSERELYGKVHNLQVENLLKITRDSLIAKTAVPEPEKAAEKAAEEAGEGDGKTEAVGQ